MNRELFKLKKIAIRIGIFENVDLSRSLEMNRSKLCKYQEIFYICVTCTLKNYLRMGQRL